MSRREGGKVFGSGSRAPVAVMILVKNPIKSPSDKGDKGGSKHEGCKIHYHDIGDYLTREQKLEALNDAVSMKGFSDWQSITPDKHHDWINQRSEAYAEFYPLGSEETKAGNTDEAIFRLYFRGLETTRDAYIYNFSHNTCAESARQMTQDYLNARSEINENYEITIDEAARRHSSNIKWSQELKNRMPRRITQFKDRYIRKAAYRPFVATNCYADRTFLSRSHQLDLMFPESSSENRVIGIPGIGRQKPFSILMTNTIPDLNYNEAGTRCFPRYLYPKSVDATESENVYQSFDEELECIDNISDTALRTFRNHYRDDTITKDDIFDYVYGVLHAPSYRDQFANDLSKMIPRIPYAPDFRTFTEAGKALADLHLNYETCQQYPNLSVEPLKPSLLWEEKPEHFLLGKRAMRFADKQERTTLIINEHVCISGIPEEAHRYVVNGRTPLEWFIDRYKIKQDKNSGILNDPNGWFENPRDLITAIERIVYVSVESTKVIENLSTQLTET